MRYLYQDNESEFVIIMETKIYFAKMGNFFENFGLSSSAISDPIGKIGGIWLLWNPRLINIRTVQITHQVVHAVVSRSNYEY